MKEIQEESIRAEMINAKKISARLKYAAELSDKLKKLKRARPAKNQKGDLMFCLFSYICDESNPFRTSIDNSLFNVSTPHMRRTSTSIRRIDR